ncbi:universal stress protein [Marinicella litoralis]|uniref:Nucleotide-binding universal stress UspA family protein n=1 Tax=Marinicella litoralis TaxID=644220 RepID=A0A4R6XLY1_9GAMM|nr:universal stress protein [Marinicella litoralis]TDR18273.1 nucleotide-binding universal stress UspA family protein [Marinicella litoralis]
MKKINHILFVSETEALDQAALNQAVELAQSNLAELTVVGCFDDLKKLSHDQPDHNLLIQQMLNNKLSKFSQQIKDLTEFNLAVKVFFGKPFIDVIREVIEFDVDLVIKAVQPTGLKSMIFGSQDLKLLRLCPCPLWLIKSTEQLGDKQFVVAIDHEPENPENELLNDQLLKTGISLALSQFAELHVVHTWELEHESFLRGPRMSYTEEDVDELVKQEQESRREWLNKTVDSCLVTMGEKAKHYLSPVLHLIKGSAAHNIPKLLKKIQPELLVMGTVGRTGIPGLFIGNTAESILFDIDCSVLAIKPEAFVSPVKLE